MRTEKSTSRRRPSHPVPDDGEAFIPDIVRQGGGLATHSSRRTSDDETEASAEEFLLSATSAEDAFEDARDEFVLEEIGGPFVDEPAPSKSAKKSKA
jgi:hypothetical protein